jgi:peptidoglycan hydrolase-like protein with peptidoglycan-binding domain
MRVGLDALALEQVLMFLGLTREADGVYGLSSVNAVKLFQKDSGILQTGVVNEETALLLNRAVQAAVAGTTDRQLDKALELLGVIR